MLATWPYISPELVFWTPIVLAFGIGWLTRWASPTGWLLLAAVVLGALGYSMMPAAARDLGQWENSDPVIREWMQSLTQPDNPTASCCGEADGYWCDNYRYDKGAKKAFCTITDDRPDEPRGRPHVPLGTVIEIPPYKLKWDRGNPTGHGIVFLSRNWHVFCYVQPGGV